MRGRLSNLTLDEFIKRVKDRASEVLLQTWNCAYSPLTALYEYLGLELTDETLGAAIGFAGGISGNGYICGGLWAAVHAVGAYARKRQKQEGRIVEAGGGMSFIEANNEIHELASRIYREFVALWGSPNCRDLNPGFNLTSPDQQRKCRAIVRKSTEIAVRVLAEKYGAGALLGESNRKG